MKAMLPRLEPTMPSTAEVFRSTSRRPTAATVSMPTPRSRIRPARVITAANRTSAYGTTHDLTLAAGMQYVHAFRKLLFMPSELTLGTEYSYDDLSDRSIGYDIRTDHTVHIVGTYLQNEWKTRKWSLLIGGRLDKHNLVDHAIFSPRANIRFNPSSRSTCV